MKRPRRPLRFPAGHATAPAGPGMVIILCAQPYQGLPAMVRRSRAARKVQECTCGRAAFRDIVPSRKQEARDQMGRPALRKKGPMTAAERQRRRRRKLRREKREAEMMAEREKNAARYKAPGMARVIRPLAAPRRERRRGRTRATD
jgi:hypothetical protein